ncbi:MAG: nicotinate-nucleotide adenylyltransferase [Defluviitaleaceae bacterium]|nr:nicotinate-nucleotide adenylyltransferase [Defluviitaleaceae bacterium]
MPKSIHDYLERCDRLAVMGGTFDPIHWGHIAVAEAAMFKFKPRRVLFIPGGQPPHKPDKPVTDGEHRYKMAMAAVCEQPAFDVSRMEIMRSGPSYTVDTMAALREICPQGAEIFFIIGADAMMEILTWQGAKKLLGLCQFITVRRPGYELDSGFLQKLREKYGALIHLMEMPEQDISGTGIRKRFAAGQPVSALMPRAAEDYARLHGLFQTEGIRLTPERFQNVQARLEEILSPRRFKHTLGTVIEAEKLAKHYKADIKKARWAALLHDCAKEFSAGKKRVLCDMWGIPIDDVMASHIDVTHSHLGAECAKRQFYVNDEEILQAIRCHTTGHNDMTLLDKIVMLADYIEPYREDYSGLSEIRCLAYADINKALAIGIKGTIEDLKQRGNAVHPHSKDALRKLQSF